MSTPRAAYFYINLRKRRWRRLWIEFQCAIRSIPIRRVEALDGVRGREFLTDSPLRGGELGLVATWVGILESEAAAQAEWAVIVEDDACFTSSTVKRVESALSSAPEHTDYVQLGWLSPGAWRPGLPVAENVRRRCRHTARLVVRRSTWAPDDTLVSGLLDGTHLHAIRATAAARWAAQARSTDQPLDTFILREAKSCDERALRTGRSIAFQVPVPSDILPSRSDRITKRRSKSRT